MSDLLDLSGRTACITGGTRGIGFGIAEQLFSHQADVVMLGRDAQRGAVARDDLLNKYNGLHNRCSFYRCDVSSLEEVDNTFSLIKAEYGNINILVLNAGIEASAASIDHTKINDWHAVMDTNLNGAFYVLHVVLPGMINISQGNIIFISSVSSITGGGTGIHYPASKAALLGMMARINYELLDKGIRANMISPGLVDTPLLRNKYPDEATTNQSLNAQVPLGRIASAEDIGKIALFLASDMSSYVCGENIIADGGRLKYRKSVVHI